MYLQQAVTLMRWCFHLNRTSERIRKLSHSVYVAGVADLAQCDTTIKVCVLGHVSVHRGVYSTAARGSDLKQAFACCENIIASVYYCFSVKQCECCVCVWRDSSGVRRCVCVYCGGPLLSPPLCFPPASPRPVAHCTLGKRESYWSWLVPAGSQIEFWQAGETSSQRDLPASPPRTPVSGTMGKAGEGLFKQLQLDSTPLSTPPPTTAQNWTLQKPHYTSAQTQPWLWCVSM